MKVSGYTGSVLQGSYYHCPCTDHEMPSAIGMEEDRCTSYGLLSHNDFAILTIVFIA